MDKKPNDRAAVVSALWTFKNQCDSRRHLKLPLVHFKMMLADAAYRDGMLARAEATGDPVLRASVASIRALAIDGVVEQAPQAVRTRSADAEPVQSIPSQSMGSSMNPALLIGVALAAILGLAYLVLAPRGSAESAASSEVAVVQNITTDTIWKTGQTYILQGPTYVDNGALLTINAGVTVQGMPGSALIVTRDASIHARGRVDAPIVFTSSKPVGSRKSGDWGGVVLLGDAPVNQDNAQVEGLPGGDLRASYGGNQLQGSCGVLEYVRIEFAGYEISRDNELNGLTLAGCGAGTIVRHVQVHRGLDDGIELFGGTADLSHVVVSGSGDDAFDWDKGWTGRAQNILLLMYPDIGDNGFEGDNDKKNPDAQPRSAPTFYNVTMLAEPSSTHVHRGMTLRRGTAGQFHNVLISGFNREPVDLRGAGVQGLIDRGELGFSGMLLHENGKAGRNAFDEEQGEADDDSGFSEAGYFSGRRAAAVANVGMQVRNVLAADVGVFTPTLVDLPLAAVGVPQDEFWDEGADYIGALRPGMSSNWLAGWTAFPAD